MGKQFIERSPVIIGIITAALIVGALFVSLGVTREDLTGGYKLTMAFADATGLAAGDMTHSFSLPASDFPQLAESA